MNIFVGKLKNGMKIVRRKVNASAVWGFYGVLSAKNEQLLKRGHQLIK